MRVIKTDHRGKENTQGRHYTGKSALRTTQVLDRPTAHPPEKS
jgi:hypothetical protein